MSYVSKGQQLQLSWPSQVALSLLVQEEWGGHLPTGDNSKCHLWVHDPQGNMGPDPRKSR